MIGGDIMDRTSCNVYFNSDVSPIVFSPANEVIETQYISVGASLTGYIGVVVPYGGYLQITNTYEQYRLRARPLGSNLDVLDLGSNVTAKIKIVGDMILHLLSVSSNNLTLDETAPT